MNFADHDLESIRIESILSRDDRKQNLIRKVDTQLGSFCFFEGLTTVMPLKTDLTELHKELTSYIPSYVNAVLPVESFHVTLVNIVTRNSFPSKKMYNEKILENLSRLNSLQQYLKSKEPGDLMFNVSKVDANERRISLFVEPSNHRTFEYIKEATLETCKILGMNVPIFKLHLTLSYQVSNDRLLTKQQVSGIRKIIHRHLKEKELIFSKAELCKFDTMCRFDPV